MCMENCEHKFVFSHKEDGFDGFGTTRTCHPNSLDVVVCEKCGEVRYNRIKIIQ